MTNMDALKNKLIDQILLTKDEKFLQAINEIFQSTQTEEKVELNSYQIEMIQMGLRDIKEGNIISEADLKKQDSEWMS